jgi:NAD(P)-dependent dehydrogenase (short-subunit alcohol dehydrogenase family)
VSGFVLSPVGKNVLQPSIARSPSGTPTRRAVCMQAGRDDLLGKVVLITGCNSGGMGTATAASLLQRGAHVIGASRSETGTVRELEKHGARVPRGDVRPGTFSPVAVDLASLDSVRAAASEIAASYGNGIDVLIANAGVMAPPFERTADGLEAQMQINFLAQFLLIRLLADKQCLKKGEAKIIQISSLSSERASFPVDAQGLVGAAKCSAESYDGMTAYRLSKLAQVLVAPEIASRLDLKSFSVHPGVVNTPLFYRNVSPAIRPLLSGLAAVACTLGAVRSPEQGAETAIFLASADGVEGQGLYWSDSAVREPNAQLSDAALRDSIWRQASELVGVPP